MGPSYDTSLSIKSKAVKFLTTLLLNNCDAFVFCVDFGGIFLVFCSLIFSKSRLKAQFSSLKMAVRKLAGKIELGSVSPQKLSKTF